MINYLHPNGLYLFDEPEAVLSPQRQLTLLMQIYKCAKEGAQFFIVTHSPILLGIPDADIYCFDNGRIHPCEYEDIPKFNFPTSEHFAELLKMNNFVIEKIYDYDRPTLLKDSERGLANWMRQFFALDLEIMTEMMQDEIIKRVENLTEESLWNGREWVADYRRLRAIAHT